MYLSRIALKNFRSYEDAVFEFDKNITLITGRNGVGKTNLLEAIYVTLQGVSFRVTDKELIRENQQWWRLDARVDGDNRQVRYQLSHRPPKQIIRHDTVKRFMHTDRLPVVLFEPNDLLLVHGSPSRRRDSLDTMLCTLSGSYKATLARYERILMQRNNALKKQPADLDDILFAWDVLLSGYGTEIIHARRDVLAEINKTIAGYYSAIAGSVHGLTIDYRTAKNDLTSTQYASLLHEKLALDTLRGTTSFGPHRDDMVFILNGVDAKHSASRGEVRTILLALKMAYSALLEEAYAVKPIILLDDVFSELDADRQRNLLSGLADNQIVITDTKKIEGFDSAIEL